jgi:precorrin-6B methylase 2
MNKILLLFLGFSFLASAGAQTRTTAEQKTDSIGTIVIQYLKEHKADQIYALAGNEFKQQLTLENFKNICESQLFPLNDFAKVSFEKTENGINKYKVGGSPELQLLIGLDAENKIGTLLVQPYAAD